ncbi:dihydroxyacetone kinase subunit L [Bacillus sp. Bva_UNVM-123]|uniref:dihydroxyacetone kinase subunit DhaL n=1 Tax=Bacillus sp. Bva_UNVM-123 TaxID=2829798 RepID=UPI00391F0047
MGFGINETKAWIQHVSESYEKHKAYLTELDQAIGDGDHGINMSRGFKEAAQKTAQASYVDLGSLFKDIGMTLLGKIGGASGPLYGTVFLKAALPLKDKQEMTISDLIEALSASLEGLKQRGKAAIGDKTMIDVWEPAIHFLEIHKDELDWEEFTDFVEERMLDTSHLEAKKGRASYLGPRSVGHIDPGAASSYYFFNELANIFKGARI